MPSSSRLTRFARRTLGAAAALLTVSARLSAQAPSKIDSVTVAPGVRVPVAHTGASRAVVDSNDVKTAAALTFSELMQARGASVNVMMSGGRLVDGGHFLVRGPSTILTEGAPLLVVDGMRMAEQEDDFGSTTSRLDDIAIDDIAKVEVLRGPSAAALYGAGASAGVIVVTTKQGHAGRMRARMRASSEVRQDAGNYADRYRRRSVGSSTNFSCSLASAAANYCVPGTLERWNPLADAGIFHNGLGTGTSFDVEGGTRTDDVRLSATVRHASGITQGDGLTQLTTRVNATHRIGTWLELTGRGSYYKNQTLGSIVGEVIEGVPYISAGPTPVDSFSRWADYRLSQPSIDGGLDHLTAGAELTIRPAHWITLRGATSRDHVDEGAERIFKFPSSGDPNDALSYVDFAPYIKRTSSWNTHLTTRATGELTVPLPGAMRAEAALIAGGERERRSRYQTVVDGGFSAVELRNFWNDALFALARVSFVDRLALNGGIRREKDTGADRQWSTYPTGDVSLRLPLQLFGAEPRLRAAYGESAQRYATWSQVVIDDQVPDLSIGGFPSAPARALPERMKELEGGVDMDWGSRGGVALTTYLRTVTNVSYPFPAPFDAILVRPLDLVSTGFELDAHVAIVDARSVRWELRGIVATNANHVTSDSANTALPNAGLVTGFPLGVAQRRPYSYNDANGDGVISYEEVTSVNTIERPGGSTPTLSMALHSELRLGNRFSLTAVVDRRSGAWTESGYVRFLCAGPEISCQGMQDPTSSQAAQASAFANAKVFGAPSFDASFTRLRELSLRWTLEPHQARLVRAHEMRVVLSGRDLATWSSWPGLDPEISSSFRASITRNDQGAVPLPRRIMVGFELDY